jgi:hypothetical protein
MLYRDDMPAAGGIFVKVPPKLISSSNNIVMSNAFHNIRTRVRIFR